VNINCDYYWNTFQVGLLDKLLSIKALNSSFLVRTFTQLGTFIFQLQFCLSIFFLQTFESCGSFLQDFEPCATQQGNFIHEALEHPQLNQRQRTSLRIKNEPSQTELTPRIFRSMNYDIFYNVHINFGMSLFSTIPSFETLVQRAL